MIIRRPVTTSQKLTLAAATVILTGVLIICALTRQPVKSELYDFQVAAAGQMQQCMEAVKSEKLARGIELSEEDRFDTGLIGESFNFITTTQGDIAAKRTSTSTDMAALMVRMLTEAGLKSGDTLACNFSGSFPAFNIAVLCACEALDITPVYICSVGASTWGANNPGYSFPEMADTLIRAGLISHEPILITQGAGGDTGKGVDQDIFSEIWQRVKTLGYPVYEEADFEINVQYRKALFDEAGADAFISVGGNITSLGKNMIVDLIGQGLITENVSAVGSGSGLIERYLSESIPTMLILNIRQLMADYGLQFDPEEAPVIGESSIYYETGYNMLYPIMILAFGLLFVWVYRRTAYIFERHC